MLVIFTRIGLADQCRVLDAMPFRPDVVGTVFCVAEYQSLDFRFWDRALPFVISAVASTLLLLDPRVPVAMVLYLP